jgi:predicted porin
MKKTLIALAALGAMTGVAHAQSTVTLYGLLDGNLQSAKLNVIGSGTQANTIQSARQTKIDSGGLNGSRWGLRLSEDIGGGMAIVGNLESGVNIDTGSSGQGGLLFGRRANVGLSSTSFGTLVIGRNSSSYDDVSADHTMMGATLFDPSNNNNGISPATAVNLSSTAPGTATAPAPALTSASTFLGNRGNANTTWIGFNTRFNNSVKYTTPNFSGFTASAMYAFGEDKQFNPAVKATKSVSANLKYANGPLLVSGGYQSEAAGGTLNPGGAANLAGAAGGTTTTTTPALRNALLSVAYDFGVVKVGAGFNRAKYKDVPAPALLNGGLVGGEFAAQNEVSLSVAVPLGATTLSAGVARSKGDTLGKATGVGIQALYSLSKRSTLYAGVASTKNFDRLVAVLPVGSNVEKTTVYGLGLRHTF